MYLFESCKEIKANSYIFQRFDDPISITKETKEDQLTPIEAIIN